MFFPAGDFGHELFKNSFLAHNDIHLVQYRFQIGPIKMVKTNPEIDQSRVKQQVVQFWLKIEFLFQTVFAFLCIRFLAASFYEVFPSVLPGIILGVGAVLITLLTPAAVPFAFTAAVVGLTALSQSSILNVPSPCIFVFSAIYLVYFIRSVPENWRKHNQHTIETLRLAEGIASTLIIFFTLSLILTVSQDWDNPVLQTRFWKQATFGYGDPLYFISSAFLWLQGLFYFRWLLRQKCTGKNDTRTLLLVFGFTAVFFFLIQVFFRIPEPYGGYVYFLPAEDISSFGSVVVTLYVYFLCLPKPESQSNRFLSFLLIAVLVLMATVSWSRATWLAAGLFSLIWVMRRVPRRWSAVPIAVLSIGVLLVNRLGTSPAWQNNHYLSRLASLVILQTPTEKLGTRFALYAKAKRMLLEHPIVGHGIGSFYMKSVNYAIPNDRYGSLPDFAHNFLLQVAVELGLPAAALLATLIAGAYYSLISNRLPHRISLAQQAVGFGLAAYIMTQLTANSLNVYASNQFFFWFLMAILFLRVGTEPRPRTDSLS